MLSMIQPRSRSWLALGLASTLWLGCELPPEEKAESEPEVVTLLFTGSIQGDFCE